MWGNEVPKRYEYNIYPGDRSRLVSGRPHLDVRLLDVGHRVPKRYEYNIYPGDRSRLVSGRPHLDVRFLDVGDGWMDGKIIQVEEFI
jgi:hypothetical protein